MAKVFEVNVQTGEALERDMTAGELAQAQIDEAAACAAEAQRAATPTLEEIVAQLQAEVAALKGA